MRITGVLIRAEVNGKWDTFDLGDPRLSNKQIKEWMRQQYLKEGNEFNLRLALILLSRDPNED